MGKFLSPFVFSIIFLLFGEVSFSKESEGLPPKVGLTLVAQHPHDSSAYCQGLLHFFDESLQQDVLYESTGRYGRSELRKVELTTGKPLERIALSPSFFGEGLALDNDRLFQITWQEHLCLVYDRKTLKQINEFRYTTEGWGLTNNGHELILSDGSATLRFLDTETFRERRQLNVFLMKEGKKTPVTQLNELEWVECEIWANVYQTAYIVRINPKTGAIIDVFDCTALVPEQLRGSPEYVLNGIAYDAKNKRVFLTGKCWPILYELKIKTKIPVP